MPAIVIADDDPDYANDLSEILTILRVGSACLVSTCKEMLESIQKHGAPKAIVLDMMLPEDEHDTAGGFPTNDPGQLRGLRVLPRLKEKRVDLRRVVVVTAFYSEMAKDLLKKQGILDANILIKPTKTTDIISRIKTAYSLREEG